MANFRSRDALDRELAKHSAVASEPRETEQHPHRTSLSGITPELRMWVKAAWLRNNPKKFLIYARPRSGTTLLGSLLNQVPGIEALGELMHFRLLAPRSMLRVGPLRSPGKVFGFKILSYQLMEVQLIHYPISFFDEALSEGYHLIHLRRNTFEQTLSLAKAQEGGRYFNSGRKVVTEEVMIDPQQFTRNLTWNMRMLEYEDEVMSHLPHHKLQYEEDRIGDRSHQNTVDRICAALNHPSHAVKARITRTGGKRGTVSVKNMKELIAAAHSVGMLVPDAENE